MKLLDGIPCMVHECYNDATHINVVGLESSGTAFDVPMCDSCTERLKEEARAGGGKVEKLHPPTRIFTKEAHD